MKSICIFSLLSFFLLLPAITNACLLFSGTLTDSHPPLLRAKLVDNGIEICTIKLRTNFGPKLKFDCIPGYKAWATPEVTTIWFEKDALFSRYSFDNIRRKELGFWESGGYAEFMFLLEAANYGCRDPERMLEEVRGF